MRIQFAVWPIWNVHFPEKDVKRITRVVYRDPAGAEQELGKEFYRLAIGRNGVSSFVMLNKGSLPKTAERNDAVTVEYEP